MSLHDWDMSSGRNSEDVPDHDVLSLHDWDMSSGRNEFFPEGSHNEVYTIGI